MRRQSSFIAFLVLCSVASVALLGGCAGAPVQEMSNARQAIAAAERAGAETHAPDLFAESQSLLKSAQANIRKQEYREAREQADLAREKAMEARRASEAAVGKQQR
jgi:hypothetical protein